MEAIDSIIETIADNFLLFFFTIIIFVIVVVVMKVLSTRIKAKTNEALTQYELDKRKLEIASKKAAIEELENSTMVLKDEERDVLESINRDNSILSRKLLFKMNEVEKRTKRLELGAGTHKMGRTLRDINNYEEKLFGKNIKKGSK